MNFTDFIRFLEVIVEGECRNVVGETSTYMMEKTSARLGHIHESVKEDFNDDIAVIGGVGDFGEGREEVERGKSRFCVTMYSIFCVRELLKKMLTVTDGDKYDDRNRESNEGVRKAFKEEFVIRVDVLAQHNDEFVQVIIEALQEEWGELVSYLPTISRIPSCTKHGICNKI